MPATFEPIATTTLGSAANNITFSSIPATYTDLRLVLVAQTQTSAQYVYVQYNADTGFNYSSTALGGNGTAAGSTRITGNNNIEGGYRSFMPVSANWGLWTMDVFSYAGSTNKTALITSNGDTNGGGGVDAIVALWRSTAAITSIKVFNTNNFSSGTTATLYGIKAA